MAKFTFDEIRERFFNLPGIATSENMVQIAESLRELGIESTLSATHSTIEFDDPGDPRARAAIEAGIQYRKARQVIPETKKADPLKGAARAAFEVFQVNTLPEHRRDKWADMGPINVHAWQETAKAAIEAYADAECVGMVTEAIKGQLNWPGNSKATVESVAYGIACVMRTENPSFDLGAFMRACGFPAYQ